MIELDFSPTFTLLYENADGKPVAIRCKGCGLVSHNKNDVEERFCGFCHVFHNDIPVSQVLNWAGDRQKSAQVRELKRKQAEVRRA